MPNESNNVVGQEIHTSDDSTEELDGNESITPSVQSDDPVSSHSYVNTDLVKSESMKSEMLRVAMSVSSPLGQAVLDNQVCMDWLIKHGVVLDCRKKKFLVQVSNSEILEVNGVKMSGSTQIISSIEAGTTGLPPDCEVEFAIKVFASTTPLSISSYHIAPKNLKELNIQLQDLLYRDFIRPSISP
ncbi:uncharacterized protein LOC128033853 [Gossypium raimondii]|uniref:uncharacterized protein LOC128033853 n=1 Tax=Gossypium raimondii TaxID=29730 RepID=UPI00227A26E4|nr:uncharacterized protein LOC128033853 [Gossypium raimondii]